MKKSVSSGLGIFLFLAFWGNCGFCAAHPSQLDQAKLQADYGGLPLAFIKNQGQMDDEVLYYLRGQAGTIYFTRYGIVYDLMRKDVGAQKAAPEDAGDQQLAPMSQEQGAGSHESPTQPSASSIQYQVSSIKPRRGFYEG